MLCGPLNRHITIEQETTGKNSVGTPVETYTLLKKCYATIKYNSGGTPYNEGAQPYSDVDFSIRYDSAINYKCRILYSGEYFKIIAIELIGRKDGIRLKTIRWDV